MTFKMLDFWATVGGAGFEHEWDEMRKERCTKLKSESVGSLRGEIHFLFY